MKQKKSYITPKVKEVRLDPDQAILQACALGGLYFSNSNDCTTGATPGTTDPCQTAIKAQSQGNIRVFKSSNAQPS